MSNVFEFGGNGGTKRWNYSDPKSTDNPMTLSISGVLVEMSNPQKKDFKSKEPVFWNDGNPVENLGLTILRGDTGEEEFFEITPSKTSLALQALDNAFKAFGEANNITFEKRSDYCIKGKPGYLITISTEDGNYGSSNPRPWGMRVDGIDANGIEVRGAVDLKNPKKDQAQSTQPAAPVVQPAPVNPAPVQAQPAQPVQPAQSVAPAQSAQPAQVPANPAAAVAQMAENIQNQQQSNVEDQVVGQDILF